MVTGRAGGLLIISRPHKDLAYQISHWIQRIVSALPPSLLNTYSSVAEVLVRGTGVSPEEHISRLREDPPHMLIGTPQAILEIMEKDKSALQPQYINTVVVDEVDYLIPSIPRGMSAFKRQKMEKQLARHPSVAAKIIDEILKTRPRKDQRGEAGKQWRDLTVKQRQQIRPPLQLVFSSATLRNHLDMNLKHRQGWLTLGATSLAQVIGKPKKEPLAEPILTPTSTILGGSGITHSVLVVDKDGRAANIEGAVERSAAPVSSTEEDNNSGEDPITTVDYVNELELDVPLSVGKFSVLQT
jgi:hypothetical protein